MGTLPKHGSVDVTTTASPAEVWEVLTDVTRTGEWSHETVGADWVDGATAAVPGARFRGRNEHGCSRWSRTCEVVTATPPHRFQFRTVPTRLFRDSTMWTFDLEPQDGGSRITQRFEVLLLHPLLDRLFYAFIPAHRDRSAALREDLERLAAVADAADGDMAGGHDDGPVAGSSMVKPRRYHQ